MGCDLSVGGVVLGIVNSSSHQTLTGMTPSKPRLNVQPLARLAGRAEDSLC